MLGRHENQDVAASFVTDFLDRHRHGPLPVGIAIVVVCLQGTVTQFDWISAAGNLDDGGGAGRITKVLSKPFRVDRRRGNDQLEIPALGKQLLQVTNQQVDIQRTLVRFVDDDCVVLIEESVAL